MRGVKPLDLVETIREGIFVLDPDLTIRFAACSFSMACFADMPAGSGVDYLWSVAWKL